MKTIVEIKDSQFERLASMVSSGLFPSLNDAVGAAIEALLMLQGETLQIHGIETAAALTTERLSGRPTALVGSPAQAPGGLPQVRLSNIGAPPLAEPPSSEDILGRAYWLFGINRVAPIKAACRALAYLASRCKGTLSLDEARSEVPSLVAEIGDRLREVDMNAGKKHGDKLSVGFPSGEEGMADRDKSYQRFNDFYVGIYRSTLERADGALHVLRLARIDAGADGRAAIGLTSAGLAFARLESPAIDGDATGLASALSGEEAEWYVGHVMANVPPEAAAIRIGLLEVLEHQGGEDPFRVALTSEWPGLSENTYTTLRVSILGRLIDLGLAEREERSKYVLTDRGQALV